MSFTLECEDKLGDLRIRRHKMHNGLCVISMVDSTAPVIAYQTWFGVGSRNESKGATGMAHLFEHLMFNQTKNLPVGEFDRRIESVGGDTNAATWVDWTYYRASIPAQHLDMIAELEATRMVDLVLEPEVVEAEREVVINERLQCVDDDIDGFASEELFRLAFDTHPYHWPTIGWMEDIKALTIPQIRAFYEHYYTPNNATLVVVGDFEESNLLDIVEKHYGSIAPSSHDVAAMQLPVEPPQTAEKRADYQKETSVARLVNGYKAPGQGHQDWPVILFTCQLLAGSASSPLSRALVVDREMASSVYCDVMPFAHPSLIEISASANRNTTLDAIQDTIDSLLVELSSKPIPELEVQKVRNAVETQFWGSLVTADGKAEALGHYQCVHGDFRKTFVMAQTLSQVTAADVQRILQTYFQPEQRTVIRVTDVS